MIIYDQKESHDYLKESTMKKIITVLFITALFLAKTISVDAASFGASASAKTVKPNGTFSVSIGGDAIGRVNLTVSNGTLSTNSIWVEQNYQTVTVTAGSSGVVTVVATPVVGFSDADANLYSPGSRSISVTISDGNVSTTKPSTTTPSTTAPSVKKSNDNNLSSLTIEGATISPKFESDITEYEVNLNKDITSIKIEAGTSDPKAKISGVGDIKVKPGLNTIKIIVTAENGSKKEYTIKAYLDETPKTYFDYKGTRVGVVRNLEGIQLDDFEQNEYKIDNETVTIFKRKNLTLIYGIDDKSQKNFYILDNETNTLTDKLIPVTISNRTVYIVSPQKNEYEFSTANVTIDNRQIEAYQTKDADYYLIYALNEEDEITEYLYESKEGTLQLYSENLFTDTCKENTLLSKIIIITESVMILLFARLSLNLYKKNKKVH